MAENTKIEWCDHTFNPWIGCTKVSPACDNCYAERLMDQRMGRAQWGAGNPRVRTAAANWREPLKWQRRAARDGTRPFVFCASLADVFDNEVSPEWRADLFELIRATPNLVWLLLTKRPGNIVDMFAETLRITAEEHGTLSACWPRNAAIGCTVVDQKEVNRDVPKLINAKAVLNPVIAFLSMEPLLGSVDLTTVQRFPKGQVDKEFIDALRGTFWTDQAGLPNPDPKWSRPGVPMNSDHDNFGGVDWVIVGGESGPNARPMNLDWARRIQRDCERLHPKPTFNFKQVGGSGSGKGGHLLDGRAYLDRPNVPPMGGLGL